MPKMSVLPRSPSVLQTPARQRVVSSEMALPVGHPHARKQSLQFNVSQTPLATSESLSLAPVTGIHSSPVPLTPLAPSPLSQSMVYGRSTSTSPPLSPFQASGTTIPFSPTTQTWSWNRALVTPETLCQSQAEWRTTNTFQIQPAGLRDSPVGIRAAFWYGRTRSRFLPPRSRKATRRQARKATSRRRKLGFERNVVLFHCFVTFEWIGGIVRASFSTYRVPSSRYPQSRWFLVDHVFTSTDTREVRWHIG